MNHTLTFRHGGPLGTVFCMACNAYLTPEDLPHDDYGIRDVVEAYLEEKENAQ